MATPAATATALHGNPTECHGNPHGTPMLTATRLGLGIGLGLGFHGIPWRSVEDSGGMPWKMPWEVLPQVVPRHVAIKDKKVHPIMHIPRYRFFLGLLSFIIA